VNGNAINASWMPRSRFGRCFQNGLLMPLLSFVRASLRHDFCYRNVVTTCATGHLITARQGCNTFNTAPCQLKGARCGSGCALRSVQAYEVKAEALG
jgi:hypothetical protein